MVLPSKFLQRIDKQDSHWIWTGGSLLNGYGTYSNKGLVHRISYEHWVGPIPDGYVVNQICRIRLCIRPDHLEAVTRSANQLHRWGSTETHCRVGHEMQGDNLFINAQGRRVCRKCSGLTGARGNSGRNQFTSTELYESRMKKVQQTESCWLWIGCTNADGYGIVSTRVEGRQSTTVVHRWFYEYWYGAVLGDLSIDHTCGVRNCVRRDHLDAVTRSENMRRMWSRKRR